MANGNPPVRARPQRSSEEGARPPRRPSRPVAEVKLVFTAGPREGTELALTDGELVLGRATDIAISVPDTSVSRRHLQLRRLPNGSWGALDLGSGNGTLVNGEPIDEEVVLRNNDTVTCGDTEFTFSDVANSTDRRPAPGPRRSTGGELALAPPRASGRPRVVRPGSRRVDPEVLKRRKRLRMLTALGLVLVAAGLGVYQVRDRQRQAGQAAEEARLQAARAQIGTLFQEGRALVREGRWDLAEAKFLEIREADPEFQPVGDFLERAKVEIPNQRALEAATQALAESRVGLAAEALAKVTPETQQFEALRRLKAAVDEGLMGQVQAAQELISEARALADKPERAAKFQQAQDLAEDILKASPEHRDATVLREHAIAGREEALRPEYIPPPPPPTPWNGVVKLFLGGDLPGALIAANDCSGRFPRCRTLMSQLEEFQALHRKLEDLDAKGLDRLLALDDRITGGTRSPLAANAGKRAGNIYYRSATGSKAAGQWQRALEFAKRALEADPSHAGAKGIVVEMRTKAKELYLFAYSLKDQQPEEAAAKFREVMAMTPASDEHHQKAKRWLASLRR